MLLLLNSGQHQSLSQRVTSEEYFQSVGSNFLVGSKSIYWVMTSIIFNEKE